MTVEATITDDAAKTDAPEFFGQSLDDNLAAIDEALHGKPEDEKQPADKTDDAVDQVDDETVDDDAAPPAAAENKPAATDSAQTIDPDLADRAIRAGLSYRDVTAFPNVESLQRVVAGLERATAPKTEQTEGKQTETVKLELPEPLKEDDATPEQIARDNRYREIIQKQNERLDQLDKWREQQITRDQESFVNERAAWFDHEVSGLGEDFEPILGKGTVRDLKAGPQLTARDQLWVRTVALEQTGLTRDEAFKQAVGSLYAGTLEKRATANLHRSIKNQSRKRMGTGSSRGRPLTDPAPKRGADLAKDPVLKAKFDELSRENG